MMRSDTYYALVPYPETPVRHAARGPLTGLALAVTDTFDVAGYPTGCGNPLKLATSGTKRVTAPAVEALLEAGAEFVGKSHTDEFAYSISGRNAHFGAPMNPAAPGRIPGGSASGSAVAVAGRLADIGLGSDAGGSVRAPASNCGVFGLRPTHGRISLEGSMPMAPSFDTVGFFARDAKTLGRIGQVLLGEDPTPLPGAARFLIARNGFKLAVPGAARALDGVLRRIELKLGAFGDSVEASPNIDDLYWAFRHIHAREAWDSHGPFIERYNPPLGPGVAERFAFGKDVTDTLVAEARIVRVRFQRHLVGLLGEGSVLVLPTLPDAAPLLSMAETALEDYRNRAARLLCLATLSGLPQVTIPVAAHDGAPVGLSLIGPAGSDRSLIVLAGRVVEAAVAKAA
jgi:amidase